MSLKIGNMTKSALLLTTAIVLSACGSLQEFSSDSGVVPSADPANKYPIQVVDAKEEITLVVAPHVFALRQADKDRVALLAESYKHVGHGEIWVVAPTGSANSAASIGAAAEIAKVMVDRGIRPTSIKMNSYQAAETDEAAPITVLSSGITPIPVIAAGGPPISGSIRAIRLRPTSGVPRSRILLPWLKTRGILPSRRRLIRQTRHDAHRSLSSTGMQRRPLQTGQKQNPELLVKSVNNERNQSGL